MSHQAKCVASPVSAPLQIKYVLDAQHDTLSFWGNFSCIAPLNELLNGDFAVSSHATLKKTDALVRTYAFNHNPDVLISLPRDMLGFLNAKFPCVIRGLKIDQQKIRAFQQAIQKLAQYEGVDILAVDNQSDQLLTLAIEVAQFVVPAFGIEQGLSMNKVFPQLIPKGESEEVASDPAVCIVREQMQLKDSEESLDIELLEELNEALAEHLDLTPIDLLLEEFTTFEEHLEISNKGLKARREFFRRLPHNELRPILELMSRITLTNEQIKALKELNFSHAVFKEKEWPAYALKALFLGRLTPMQVAPLLLYDECQLNDKGGTLIYDLPHPNAIHLMTIALSQYWTSAHIEALCKKLATLPPEERVFFVTKLHGFDNSPMEPPLPKDKDRSILEQFLHRLDFRVCLLEEDDETMFQVVIPPKLLWEIMKARFGARAKMPNPVLGYSRAAKNFTYPHQRDALIPCRYFSTPKTADTFPCTKLEFYHHEVYHLTLDSSNPHVAAAIELALYFEDIGSNYARNVLLDRDCRFYLDISAQKKIANRALSDQEVFWIFLSCIAERMKSDPGNPAGEDILFPLEIVSYVKENNERWTITYGINLAGLKTLVQTIDPQAEIYSSLTLFQAPLATHSLI